MKPRKRETLSARNTASEPRHGEQSSAYALVDHVVYVVLPVTLAVRRDTSRASARWAPNATTAANM